jgi:gliding motility-associated-like protein
MKRYLQIAFLLVLVLLSCVARGQNTATSPQAKQNAIAELKQHFLAHHPDGDGWDEFLDSHLRNSAASQTGSQNKINLPAPSPNVACTNVDFEDGSLNGWSSSTGFNPNYNGAGCCASTGGAQAIMTGGGTDPCGGFPVVAPGGAYSLRLGDNNINGVADRVEQSFTVSANNTFFTYQYAVVLEDPGHSAADQPSFQIEMLDGNGNQITCAQYQVSAGQGIPGFQNSPNCPGVVYKPWTTVAIDLSGFLNQTVTLRFTTYDCALGGHYGYAYIDGSCLQFQSVVNDTICNNGTMQLAGIPGAASWLWNGSSVSGATTQNVTINNAGNYDVQSISVSGCPLPTLFYNINNRPAPVASFSTGGTTLCNTTVSFTNTSNYQGSSAGSAFWSFGDGTTSFMDNPVHTYPNPGTYNVQLIVYSSNGCSDTINSLIQLLMPMNSSFSYNANCAGTPAQFQDNSTVAGGSINSWYWDFGDGTSSASQNPLHIYAIAGTYNVILTVTSTNGCSGGDTLQVTINPAPNVNFSSSNVCFGTPTALANNSTISTGSITSYSWDFNMDGISDNTSQNPAWTFSGAGNINVNLTATSNNGCSATYTGQVLVYPQPVAAFTTNNNCEGLLSSFSNTTYIQSPGSITSVQWNFGDGTSSLLNNPGHLFINDGSYIVSMTATSTDGCVGTYSSAITIYPAPQVSFSAAPVCKNNASVFVNNSSVNNGTLTSYKWDFNNDGVIDNTSVNPNFVYSADGTFLASLTVTTNNACTASVSVPVVVHPVPNANFVVNSSCLGNPTSFTDISTISSGSIAASKWDFESDGITDATGMNVSFIYPAAGQKNATLIATSNNNCSGGSQKMIYVNYNPVVNFSVNDPDGCPQHCVTFSNLSTLQNGTIASYLWNFGDNSPSTSLASPSHCYNTGTYNVSLLAVSDSGCVGTASQNGMITVYPEPVAGFAFSPFDPDVLQPFVTIADQSSGADSLLFQFSDGASYSQANFQHLFSTDVPATYTVTQYVTNVHGCVDTATTTIVIKPAFTLYVPNAFTPNFDGFNDVFKAEGIGVKEFSMMIYDRWGNMIFHTKDISEGWDGKVEDGHSGESSQMDVYVWKAVVKDLNDKMYNRIGSVTLVR